MIPAIIGDKGVGTDFAEINSATIALVIKIPAKMVKMICFFELSILGEILGY
jgi:hypothetical protein